MSAISLQKIYEQDFYDWTSQSALLMREGKFSELDVEHIAEELENMGKSAKRELASRIAVLIAHLLKWKIQPERRGNSWKATIKIQRIELERLLKESPSLKYRLEATFTDAYEEAVIIASAETNLSEDKFNLSCPFSLEQCLDAGFFPEN